MDVLFRNVDCIRLTITDLEAGMNFYCDQLGHKLVWRTDDEGNIVGNLGQNVTD